MPHNFIDCCSIASSQQRRLLVSLLHETGILNQNSKLVSTADLKNAKLHKFPEP